MKCLFKLIFIVLFLTGYGRTVHCQRLHDNWHVQQAVSISDDTPNFASRRAAPQNEGIHVDQNPKGLYAGLFFGTSRLDYSFDGEKVFLTSIDFGNNKPDSVVTLADGVASINPQSDAQRMNLDAGFWIGYFPGFLNFQLSESSNLALGGMTQFGLSFNGGFGGWLGIGPEVMFASGPFSVNMGYGIGWTGTQRKIGTLALEGINEIVIEESSLIGCAPEDFSSESIFCRLHNSDSELVVIGSGRSSSTYLRLGYSFGESKTTGIGLVVGMRSMRTTEVRYELWGPHVKQFNEHRSGLSGAEMEALNGNFGMGGLFVQIELFTRPF